MSERADYFREQAERAERLSHTISDHDASKHLMELSNEYRKEAERLDRGPRQVGVEAHLIPNTLRRRDLSSCLRNLALLTRLQLFLLCARQILRKLLGLFAAQA